MISKICDWFSQKILRITNDITNTNKKKNKMHLRGG